MANLTKSQQQFLYRAMKDGEVRPRGSQWVTADALTRRGLVETRRIGARQITRAGFDALLDYWARKDAASGCVAYQQRRKEVEDALAARFPEQSA